MSRPRFWKAPPAREGATAGAGVRARLPGSTSLINMASSTAAHHHPHNNNNNVVGEDTKKARVGPHWGIFLHHLHSGRDVLQIASQNNSFLKVFSLMIKE